MILKYSKLMLKIVLKKCKRVDCTAIYEATMASLKLLYDLIFMCCKKKT